jgi:hypothetical protein
MDTSTMPDVVDALEQILITEPKVEQAKSKIRTLAELENHGEHDPNCLLGNRY